MTSANMRSEDPLDQRLAALVAEARAGDPSVLPPPRQRRRIRENARVSRRRLARALGVSVMSICRWEDGSSEPRPQRVADYKAALDALEDV